MTNKLDDIQGRWALVTGASSGIGYEFCELLCEKSCNLIMISNKPKELAEKAEALRSNYQRSVLYMNVDLTEESGVDEITKFLDDNHIIPFILINNAGIFDFKSVSHLSTSRIDTYIDLHIRSLTHLTKKVGEKMAGVSGGYIINMSSMSCWMPMPGIAMYTATKAYIRAFSRAYRIEMKGKNVMVMVACPGGIATDLFGLSKKWQRIGVMLGILDTPTNFAKKAVKRALQGKAQYINGLLNRISIVAVSCLPEWARVMIKRKLLDKLDK